MDWDEKYILILLGISGDVNVYGFSSEEDDSYQDLLSAKLIEEMVCDEEVGDPKYVVTGRGKAYIKSLIKVPLPSENTQWVTDWRFLLEDD